MRAGITNNGTILPKFNRRTTHISSGENLGIFVDNNFSISLS